LCLDYDGTLTPIASRPEEARPTSALVHLLSALVQRPRVEVVVASGRPLTQLCELLPLRGLSYIGTHGLELRTAEGDTKRLLPEGAFVSTMARLRQDIAAALPDQPGFLLEDKGQTLALHYRLAQPQDAEHAISSFLMAVQKYQQQGSALEVIYGKKVVEVRPIGVNKGKALQWLWDPTDRTTIAFYFGDDASDEDAFRLLQGQGVTVLVADPPRPTAALYYLRHPGEVSHFLSLLLKWR
jgi:trehalose 6-phosphate phosphatase